MTGKLTGVGVGPGDPGLLTLKAAEVIRSSDILILPTGNRETCRAYRTALDACPDIAGKKTVSFEFPMNCDRAEIAKRHERITGETERLLMEGLTAAFLTIGDPHLYSTFGYVADKLMEKGFEVETVPGVTSFSAAASVFPMSLAEGDEEIHIIPGSSDIEKALSLPGTKVIMKCGKRLPGIIAAIREYSASHPERPPDVRAVKDCGLPTEEVYIKLEDIPADMEYMIVLIINLNSRIKFNLQ